MLSHESHYLFAGIAGVLATLCGLNALVGALPPDWGSVLTGICSILVGLGIISASKTSRPMALATLLFLPVLSGCSGATIKQLETAGSALIGIGGALYQDTKEAVDCSRQVVAGIPSGALPDCAKTSAPTPGPAKVSTAPPSPFTVPSSFVKPPFVVPARERFCYLDPNGEHCIIP